MRTHVLAKGFIFICATITATANASAFTLSNNMVYELRFPHLANKCMDVNAGGTSDGTNIQLWSCNGTAAQRFKAMALDETHFQLVDINSGRCVDVTGSGTSDGTNVQLWACNGSDAQAFRTEPSSDGSYAFPNKGNGRCLDVNAGSSSDGANIQVWACNGSERQRIQAQPSYADTMVEAFNSTYLVQAGGLTFYKESLHSNNVDYFWMQALSILALQDAQIRLSSAAYRDKISALLTTFMHHNGNDWTWNQFNDDLAWAGLAFARGYKISGNPLFLEKARHAFDLAYRRGWTNELGGGLWWDVDRSAKEALSNNPIAILGCYIYQASGNAWYRDRSVEIYNWVRANLYSTTTGAVYRLVWPDGTVDHSVSAYNIGTFVEAANCLQKVTGPGWAYYDDAVRAIDYVKNSLTIDGILAPLGSSEFARGLGEFVRDNKLHDKYYGWMLQNSQAAWRSRRQDNGIGWNKWTQPTPTDVDVLPLDAKDGVTMLQVAPL